MQVVVVHTAAPEDTRTYSGVVAPRREATLGFRVAGRIDARLVDVGAVVTEGQVLARLDPTDFALSVRSAQSDLDSAHAQQVQASAEATRYGALVHLGHVSASDNDQRQASASVAHERVRSAEAALRVAQDRLAYAELRAPASGVITGVLAEQGAVVADGTPVLKLAEAGPPEAQIAVPEDAVADLRQARATVSLWSRPDQHFAATLREVAPIPDAALRTYAARFVINDPPPWLALGMTATVHLAAPGDGVLVAELPASALVDRGSGPMVWTVADAPSGGVRLAATPVRIVRFGTGTVSVSGVPDGARVVSVGGQKLDPAAAVRVADTRPSAG